jgi:hypothetical protein
MTCTNTIIGHFFTLSRLPTGVMPAQALAQCFSTVILRPTDSHAFEPKPS